MSACSDLWRDKITQIKVLCVQVARLILLTLTLIKAGSYLDNKCI